ncbi:MAG: CAAX prenyl protease-related protein [Terracidiphilus sp.]
MSGFPRLLLGRLFLLAGILGADIFLLAVTPHAFSLLGPSAPFGIAAYGVYLGLGYSELKTQKEELPFSTGFFLAHLACVLAILLADIAALHGFGFLAGSMMAHLVLRALLLVGIALLALACVPLETWVGTLRRTKRLWLYATLAGAIAWCLRFPMQSLWDTSSSAPGRLLQILTFHSVKTMLGVFLPNIYVDPDSFVIGTQRFSIFIAEACSGLEGLGLVLAFTTIWLWYFRKESRFPQALLLVPCALVCVWMLNVLRISALVLIGNAGYSEIAMAGFHSQAGWIAFTAVGFGFSMATRKLAWVRKIPDYATAPDAARAGSTIPGPFLSGAVSSATGAVAANPALIEQELVESGESPAIGAYLVPFLAILAASFISKAASGHFECLYPLRFLVAAIAIWHYMPELKRISWRFGWLAPVTGAVVFVVWLIPSFWSHSAAPSQLGEALAALPPAARWSWIAFRVAAAVITVPIAEELAFRGYLARRLVNREFDSVPFSAVTTFSIGLSSAAFGLMHGPQWIVGTFAGLAFAGVMKWKGRISDTIVAHATSNFLLATWVLSRGDWSQW